MAASGAQIAYSALIAANRSCRAGVAGNPVLLGSVDTERTSDPTALLPETAQLLTPIANLSLARGGEGRGVGLEVPSIG